MSSDIIPPSPTEQDIDLGIDSVTPFSPSNDLRTLFTHRHPSPAPLTWLSSCTPSQPLDIHQRPCQPPRNGRGHPCPATSHDPMSSCWTNTLPLCTTATSPVYSPRELEILQTLLLEDTRAVVSGMGVNNSPSRTPAGSRAEIVGLGMMKSKFKAGG